MGGSRAKGKGKGSTGLLRAVVVSNAAGLESQMVCQTWLLKVLWFSLPTAVWKAVHDITYAFAMIHAWSNILVAPHALLAVFPNSSSNVSASVTQLQIRAWLAQVGGVENTLVVVGWDIGCQKWGYGLCHP